MKHLQISRVALVSFFCIFSCNANSPETKYLLAEKLLSDKKYAASINELQVLVDKSPNSVLGLEAQYKIAQIQHLYLGLPEEAVKSYELFKRRTKDQNRKNEVELILADLQFRIFENYDEAIASYSKLVKENPEKDSSEELIFRLGRSFYLKAKFFDALKMYEFLLQKFPQGRFSQKTKLEIGNTLGVMGKCSEAVVYIDKVSSSLDLKNIVLAKFEKASCLEELDDLDAAYEIFSSIKNDYPFASIIELKLQKIKRRKILRKR